MPVGELVMHKPPYSKKEPSLGVIIEIYEERGSHRYKVEWVSNDLYQEFSTEDSSTIQSLRKAYRRWKEKNVAVQTEEEGT